MWFFLGAELRHRATRVAVGVASLAVGLAVFLSVQAYVDGYRVAARAPLTEIGTDIVAQRQGDRPKTFEGVVLPHSTAPLHPEEVSQVAGVPGVQELARAVFLWSFQDNDLIVALGIEPEVPIGPGRLRAGVTAGRFLSAADTDSVVVDASYARQHRLQPGGTVTIAGERFTIVGVVDSSRAGQVANANVYLPLAAGQRLVARSPAVTEVHDTRPSDVNVLFVRGDPRRGDALAGDITDLLGADALVTTPRSFDTVLGSTFALLDRFGLVIGLLVLLIAVAGLIRVVSGGLAERRRDIAIMRAVGWPRWTVARQLAAESAAITGLGLIAGAVLAVGVSWLLSRATVTVPIPWELSPTPHFLAGGAREFAVTVPLNASVQPGPLGAAVAVSIAVAAVLAVLTVRRVSSTKPAEVWRVA